jgi:hypothetical protein
MNTQHNFPNTGDEVDRLLSSFYRSETPTKWPAAPRPWAEKARTQVASSSNPASRSRWALAASVAILVGGCWYLSSNMTNGKQRPDRNFDGGEANKKHIDDLSKKPKTP